jgi:alkylated DNA nucleotide flippase Atl1
MSNKKQSGLYWLIQQLQKTRDWQRVINEANQSSSSVRDVVQQAKAMEKEQIIDSFGVGCQVESTRLIGYQDLAEQYYKETYGE